MKWDDCSKLVRNNEHSVFSPSQPAFYNYTPEKLLEVYRNKKAAEEGTKKHELAAELIKQRERLWKAKRTLNMYVNDAIALNMDPEVVLYYTQHFWGRADAISYDERNKFLRIHDLKTGVTKPTGSGFSQLEGYAALFFLRYGDRLSVSPETCDIELRIYQNNEIKAYVPYPEDIRFKMDVYIDFEDILQKEDREMASK